MNQQIPTFKSQCDLQRTPFRVPRFGIGCYVRLREQLIIASQQPLQDEW
jgi:hypothetical protein